MSRPLRINRVDGWYHVTARGNAGEGIYRDDSDRRHFLELVGALPERYGVQVHGYVLMSNHYHLLLRTAEANLNRAMQWLNVSYTVWFNRRHQRSGHLLGGRYGSVLIEGGSWLLETSVYVHLNPIRIKREGLGKQERSRIRAGRMAPSSPEEIRRRLERLRGYAWSSYPAYAGYKVSPGWLTRTEIFGRIRGGGKAENGAAAYRAHVEGQVREGHREAPWKELQNRTVLGSKAFAQTVMKMVRGDKREQPEIKRLRPSVKVADVIHAVEVVKEESWERFRDRHGDDGRDMVLWLARQRSGLTLRELGEAVGGLDYRSVSSAIRRVNHDVQANRHLRRVINKAMKHLQNNEI